MVSTDWLERGAEEKEEEKKQEEEGFCVCRYVVIDVVSDEMIRDLASVGLRFELMDLVCCPWYRLTYSVTSVWINIFSAPPVT